MSKSDAPDTPTAGKVATKIVHTPSPKPRDLRGLVIHGSDSERRMLDLRDHYPNSAEALLGLVQRYKPEWLQPVSVKQTGEASETSDPKIPQAKDPPG